MLLNDMTTWSEEVLDYLQRHQDIFLRHELAPKSWDWNPNAEKIAREYDDAVIGLRKVLNRYTLEGGYHCTRLAQREIDCIKLSGFQLPNRDMLHSHIQAILEDGLIEPEIAERLRLENLADERNRANIIWFFFFPPHVEFGIEEFFRFWGGERLYRSHQHVTKGRRYILSPRSMSGASFSFLSQTF